jgi:hypothetical protein
VNAEREPLLIRGAIVAAVTALLHVLIVLGVLPIDATAEHAVAGAVDLIGTAVLVVWTRGKVTPVEAPKLPTSTVQALADKTPRHLAG